MSQSISKIAKLMAVERTKYLVDETLRPTGSLAKDCGLTYPVFIHSSLWDECVAATHLETADDEVRRLKTILHAASERVRGLQTSQPGSTENIIDVEFCVVDGPQPGSHTAYLTVGPYSVSSVAGESDLSPVFTLVAASEFDRE